MEDAEKLRLVRNAFQTKLEEMETPAEMLNLIDHMNPTSIRAFCKEFIRNRGLADIDQGDSISTGGTEKVDYADSF